MTIYCVYTDNSTQSEGVQIIRRGRMDDRPRYCVVSGSSLCAGMTVYVDWSV